MTAIEPLPSFTFDEYVRFEQISEVRHEWVTGQIYAKSGGTERHALLSLILYRLLSQAARARRCRAFHADRMVRTTHAAYYPDVMIVCGRAGDRQFDNDASWIVEVLSPSTYVTDKREKAAAYLELPSIEGYIVADPDHRLLDVGVPAAEGGGGWAWTSYLPGSQLVVVDHGIDVADLWRQLDDEASLT